MNRADADELADLVESIWVRQVAGWEQGQLPTAEDFFAEFPRLKEHPDSAVDVIFNEVAILAGRNQDAAEKSCEGPDLDEQALVARFPEFAPWLRKQFQVLRAVNGFTDGSEVGDAGFSLRSQAETNSGTATDTATSVDIPQTRPGWLQNRYELRRELGRGATSIVWEAWDHRLDQGVAIKQPHAHLCASVKARARLMQEARAVSRLHHPHIVPFREAVEAGDLWFLVSPLVEGRSLQSWMDEFGRPAIEQSIEWCCQIAQALHYAHQHKILHRDVKPSNIIIADSGQAMVTDFGLAAMENDQQSITQSGELIGTPAYMPPEQVANHDVDARSDVYALGATLYHLVTGELPFRGSVSVVLQQIVAAPVPAIRKVRADVSRDLEVVVQKCLQKEATQRYDSAGDFCDDLRRLQLGEPVRARPVGLVEKLVRTTRKYPLRVALVVGMFVLSAFLAGSLWQLGNVTSQRNRAQLAERQNRELLSAASVDAGRLAMQRGQFRDAVAHLENALLERDVDHVRVYLDLVECHLILGDVMTAQQQLGAAQDQLVKDDLQAAELVCYWQLELAAHGLEQQGNAGEIPGKKFLRIDLAKQRFLQGLDATDSLTAYRLFCEASRADPHHYSARRLALIMGLSLARFDEVRTAAVLARELYPEDIDFKLIDALAHAATAELDHAKSIVLGCRMADSDQAGWLEFCEFMERVTLPTGSPAEMAVDAKTSNSTLQDLNNLMIEFVERFQPLLEQRRWRFPPRIAQVFERMPRVDSETGFAESIRQFNRQLAEVHPEGTLQSIVADTEIIGTGINPIDQLLLSRDRFLAAAKVPAFYHGHAEYCQLGVFANSVALALIHRHDVEANQQYYLAAVAGLNPRSAAVERHLRTIVICLFRAEQIEMAKPFIDAWLASDAARQPGNAKHVDAHWYQALYLQHTRQPAELVRECRLVLNAFEDQLDEQGRQSWAGLQDWAESEIKKILD